ncbi:hypothetical protein PVAND_011671 [Polypedilum vanderplanki]|uniref:Transmembrane protein 26 n=1 Tax=Polypedilum vanderplanki TaxID=319348 RepID=A0A9J6CK66_POLVA|nr:hypothetical protein PVAND_011671 [Polypedilum vanderplanki]
MAKFIATLKAIITRLLFAAHGAVAIFQVTQYKKSQLWWILAIPIGILGLEGIFTLTIKKNQEWRWFCPSVFLYLSSVVPAIWLLELDKVERRHKIQEETFNLAAAAADLKELDKLLGVKIKLPELKVDAETWVTLIEQFLMLVLIIGRWLLPKGDLTRDQLSQLLLVYIGTAADIIEFFDSFKDNKIADEQILVFLTLSIWSWSLLQFTIVLTATRARKPRGASSHDAIDEESNNCCSDCCCSIDIWGIALNIILQDAPFLTFRLLIIIHYEIISYINIFFTYKCFKVFLFDEISVKNFLYAGKNTLVILLQLYRLYVVYSENRKSLKIKRKQNYYGEKQRFKSNKRRQHDDVYTISNEKSSRNKKRKFDSESEDSGEKCKEKRSKSNKRKDTGYGTATGSSYEDKKRNKKREKQKSRKDDDVSERSRKKKSRESSKEEEDERSKRHSKRDKIVELSESQSDIESEHKKKKSKKKRTSSSSSSSSSSE